ncbi:MAG: hypothetical protein EOM91_01595 [Sphingobacteriia bacterium]|nr:hypothetical protein [Sphingobacteriia bacterium]NCC39329.1 hypothetical protein [Gammaproteobacteria bacterium]
MPIPRVHYRVVGQDDYMLEITLESDGAYRIDCGDHTSHTPRRGMLAPEQLAALDSLISALGAPREHLAPAGATGFLAELTIGEQPVTRVFKVWEGAIQDEPDLMPLIRALEVI